MMTQTSTRFIQPARTLRRAFTLVELLVVIGIIVLLIGLLLPAIAAVSTAARNSKTDSILTEFAKACEQFQLEHGFYPGLVPEQALAAQAASNGGAPWISSTENALLHLMGGYVLSTDPNYDPSDGEEFDFSSWGGPIFVVLEDTALPNRPSEMGSGPVINGKQFPAYYTPGQDEFAIARGQVGERDFQLPDVLDAWGTPVVYLKRARTVGPIVGPWDATPAPQFVREGANSYLLSAGLGERLANQVPGGGTVEYSMLNASGGASQNASFTAAEWNLMVILGHQGLMTDVGGDIFYSQPRGEFAVISAGEDGTFFSQQEFDSTDADNEIPSPAAVKEFDDIARMGGGG